MSSSKVQKDRISKLHVKDKKLMRLLNCPDMTDEDDMFLNLTYEER